MPFFQVLSISHQTFNNADLTNATLRGANLKEANLEGAVGITFEGLDETLIQDTILPDGSRHPGSCVVTEQKIATILFHISNFLP